MFGLPPAWYAAKTDVHDMLNAAGRGQAGGRSRLRSVLAASELALATVLLIGAGLLVRTFLNLEHARLGFDSSKLLTFQVSLPVTKYPLADRALLFHRSLVESLRAMPGVRAAAVSSGVPFGQSNYTRSPFIAVGDSALPPDTPVPTDWRIVSPGYFETMAIPLVRGRDFTDHDGPKSALVTIVSQSAAKTFWGDRDPIGRVLRRPNDDRLFTVVGVVSDVRSIALNQESPMLYYPSAWRVFPLMDVVIRSDAAPASLIAAARRRVQDLDADLPLANVRTMDALIATAAAQPRLSAQLVGGFAVLAVVIAGIGIYGVLAYSVSQRRREIGLRLALGSRIDALIRLIVGEGMMIAGAGIIVGVLAALLLGRAIGGLVYGVQPRDPVTVIGVVVVVTTVALMACWIPARRAARVDPLTALREE
jgi:putative ABC transport system permease protein